MSDMNKFTFEGGLYEKRSDGSLDKVITVSNTKSSGIIDVETTEDQESVTITTAGLTIEDGLLCATFYEEEEV